MSARVTLFVDPLRRFGKRVGGCEGGRLGRDKAQRQSPAGDSTQANHSPPSGRSRPMGEGGRQRPPRSAANPPLGSVVLVLSALSRGPCGRSGESSPVRWSGEGSVDEVGGVARFWISSRVLIAGVRAPFVLGDANS